MGSDEQELRLWSVIATDRVQENLDDYVYYLLMEKQNEQAADSLVKDYEDTVERLKKVAGSLKLIDNPRYGEAGYRKIRFLRHDYYLIYRVEDNTAIIYRMLHDLQDMDKALQ